MATLTIIISLIILAVYIFLLVAKSIKVIQKPNGMLMVVQGALWTMIAVSNWAENTVVNRSCLHYSNCVIVYLWNP
ncbi:MAG: hypothetical protein ACLS61_06195 [Ruminococcus sp.]